MPISQAASRTSTSVRSLVSFVIVTFNRTGVPTFTLSFNKRRVILSGGFGDAADATPWADAED
jgi:hypothetical protein